MTLPPPSKEACPQAVEIGKEKEEKKRTINMYPSETLLPAIVPVQQAAAIVPYCRLPGPLHLYLEGNSRSSTEGSLGVLQP